MFWENLCEFCTRAGIAPTNLVSILDISRGSVTHWKQGKIPHYQTQKKIADYFGVTVDELLADRSSLKKEEAPADTPEAKFMETVRGLSVEEFRELENYLNYILSKRRKDK